MNKTLEYYLSLDYPVEIRKIPDRLGGGYSASIPHLGRMAFFAVGDSIEEALDNLQDSKKELFSYMIEHRQAIPPPPPLPEEEEEQYSGKILLRIPKDLHLELAKRAQENDTSINQYAAIAIAKQLQGEKCAEETVERIVRQFGNLCLIQETGDTAYDITTMDISESDNTYTPLAAFGMSASGYHLTPDGNFEPVGGRA